MHFLNFNKLYLIEIYTRLFMIFSVAILFVACSRATTSQQSTQPDSSAPALSSTTLVKNNLGHIAFQIDEQSWVQWKARSIEQPEVTVAKLDDGKFILSNLTPGPHTLVVEAQSATDSNVKGVAAIQNIQVEANTVFDLGAVPLQKPGAITGRLLNVKDGTVLANGQVRIPLLGMKVNTNAAGEFTLTQTPAGQWSLSATTAGAGSINNVPVFVKSNQTTPLGDLWLGDWVPGANEPVLLNAPNGIVNEKFLKVETRLPSTARSFKVVDELGLELLSRRPVQKSFNVELTKSGLNQLRLIAFDGRDTVLGTVLISVIFDPFSDGQSLYTPQATLTERSIVSPSRSFSIQLNSPPTKASEVKISFKDIPSSSTWAAVQTTNYTLTLPKKNSHCGKHEVSIIYKTSDNLESQETLIPVTLSCWQRIPQRAQLEKLVGVDNAATWTGEYAFVWSGKLTKPGLIGVRGSYTPATIDFLESLAEYNYLDGGYIYNPTTKNMEFIVTDSAPMPRARPGVHGRKIGTRNLIAVYGGENQGNPIADGAIYDVSTNAWISMHGPGAPSPRIKPSVFFVSDFEVLVWGGLGKTNLGYDVALGDGAIYNMKTHQWRKMSEVNAPSPRYSHVGIWSGGNAPEFVVLGGMRPGEVYLDSGARYSPASDQWIATPSLTIPAVPASGTDPAQPEIPGHFAQAGAAHTRLNGQLDQKGKIIVFGGKGGHGTYIRKGFIFDLDENRITQSRIPLPSVQVYADIYLNPTVFLDGDGSTSDGSRLWIVSGSGSDVDGDVEPRIVVYGYKDGSVPYTPQPLLFNFLTRDTLSAFLTWHSISGKSLYQCCEDWLAFSSGGKTVLMNGTMTNDSSVYASTYNATIASGRSLSGTTQVARSKTFLSFYIQFVSQTGTIGTYTAERIDGTRQSTSNNRPNGPINVYETNTPVWDPTSNRFIIYGGASSDSILIKQSLGGWYTAPSVDTLGGWMYDIATRSWTELPLETGYTVSRFYALNYFLNGLFVQIGGRRTEGSSVEYKFDGIMLNHTTNPITSPTAILSANPDFDFTPVNDWKKSNFTEAATCQDNSKLMFVGGRRVTNRAITGIDVTTAHIQKQVILDTGATPPSLSYAPENSLGARNMPTVLSTPNGCFVWGGYTATGSLFTNTWEEIADRYSPLGNGQIYDFSTNAWNTISSSGAPSARSSAIGLWTGQEVLLWGGMNAPRLNLDSDLNAPKGVSFYNPTTSQWRSLPAAANEPRFRATERPVWTGNHMFLWKTKGYDTSYFYTPSENTWSTVSQPAGFALNIHNFDDSHVIWMNDRLLVMPSSAASQLSVMAFFIPPDP